MSERVIIDTDPGVDDALALAYACANEIPVTAITTVYGNVNLADVTRNAGYIVKSLGVSWPVYAGADGPIASQSYLSEAHGATGLGDVQPLNSEIVRPEPQSAREFLGTLATQEGGYDLLCLGPLTNIAEAMRTSPGMLRNIGRLVIMGGAFAEPGNVGPHNVAEFNVYNDPAAWQKVVDLAAVHCIDTTIIPAEVCRRVVLTEEDLLQLQDGSRLGNMRSIINPYLRYYLSRGHEGAVLYDVLVPLYWKCSELFAVEPVCIDVNLSDGPNRGKTTSEPDLDSSIKLCTNVDEATAKQHIMRSLL